MSCSVNILQVGARDSPLSIAQVEEVLKELRDSHPDISFAMTWVKTTGDKDRSTSLRHLEKTDFFTKEIDEMQLQGKVRLSIHSAKDLPEPLPEGLTIVAITRGVDPSDALVFRANESLNTLLPHNLAVFPTSPSPSERANTPADDVRGFRKKPLVGTSSVRREECLANLCPDLQCVDVRGTIQERLNLLNEGKIDALIVAEAALIRLKLHHLPRMSLPGPVAKYQGQLAIVARTGDEEMKKLFSPLDSRIFS